MPNTSDNQEHSATTATTSFTEGEPCFVLHDDSNQTFTHEGTRELTLMEFKTKIYKILSVVTSLTLLLAAILTPCLAPIMEEYWKYLCTVAFGCLVVLFFVSICVPIKSRVAYICLGVTSFAVATYLSVPLQLSAHREFILWEPINCILLLNMCSLLFYKGFDYNVSKPISRMTYIVFFFELISSFFPFPNTRLFYVLGLFSFLVIGIGVNTIKKKDTELSEDLYAQDSP